MTHTKKEIAEAVSALKQEYPNFKSTANWIVSSSRSDWKKNMIGYYNRACHASLPTSVNGKTVVAFENGWNRKGATIRAPESAARAFVSWFLYESPYGEFILNRDDFDTCLNYGYVVSTSLPQPILMNIAIISRHLYEHTKHTFTYFEEFAVNKGIDPFICYNFFCNTAVSAYNLDFLKLKVTDYSGHRVAGAYTIPVLLNVYRGVYGQGLSVDSMVRNPRIHGASHLFGNTKEGTYHCFCNNIKTNETFVKALIAHRATKKGKPAVYVPPNPFAPRDYYAEERVLGRGEFNGQELLDFVIPYVDNIIRKELQNNG